MSERMAPASIPPASISPASILAVSFPPLPDPATLTQHDHVVGPFLHGTKARLAPGDQILPGQESNYQAGRISRHVYFTTWESTAAWGAELACALVGSPERGHVYVVEPTGPFEDDPNVTDKRAPGNPTQSYRSRHGLVVRSELLDWQGHTAEQVQAMVEGLERLRAQGLDHIED